jgi:hypothetical protein
MPNAILKDFMKEFSTKGKYLVPIGLIPEEVDKQAPFEGIEIALVFFWSYKNKLLNDDINKLVKKFDGKSLTYKKLLKIMRSTIGTELLNDFYNPKGKDFVVDYIAFTSQWHYRFYQDLVNLYPDTANFAEIAQNTHEYERVYKLLSSRFKQYNNDVKNIEQP